MFKIKLFKQLHNGSNRNLTQKECNQIIAFKTSVQPTTSNKWQLERSDGGFYSIRVFARSGESATWGIEEA